MRGPLARTALGRIVDSFPRLPLLSLLAIASVAGACGGDPPAVTPATPPAPSSTSVPDAGAKAEPAKTWAPAAVDVDPVVVGLGRDGEGFGTVDDAPKAAAGVERVCEEGLALARQGLAELRALDGAPDAAITWGATVARLDRVFGALRNAGDFPALMAVSHPDERVREKAKACEPKIDAFETALWLDPAVAKVIKRYAAKKEPLPPVRARLLEHVLRDFRRNGLDLDAPGQERIRTMNEEITKLAQAFDTNLAGSKLTVSATPEELDGLPKEWLAAHPPKNGKVEITTDYPDYVPVITYAKNRKLALELYKQFDNRAADKNVAVIERLLSVRGEKAKLLGYPTWSDYVLEPRMAKDSKTVAAFLDGLRKHLAKKGESEIGEFRAMRAKLGVAKATDPIPPSERLFLEDQLRKAKYGLDSKEVSQYFEVRKVKEGILAIASKLFDIRFRPSKSPTWHPDIEAVEVTDATGKPLGRFYFDLYPRDGKYKHAAVFSIRDTVKLDDGARVLPIAAIECNFPKPGAAPALMNHGDVVTFFHEFGHILHHVLSESDFARFSGSRVARDFVESPSQMLEEWAWSKETLDLFARHHDTNAPLPKALHAAMLRSRGFGRAVATQRQLFLAALDQAYHTRQTPLDTTKVLAEVHDAYTPFKYVEGTHFQASFGHLIEYDAGYYGYQWALSIAQDLFTRFKKEGLLNPKTAAAYRAAILAPGGSDDEAAMITRFLGRAPNDTAYRAYLLE